MSVREITCILVSWRDEDDLPDAIESLARARGLLVGGGPELSLVLVENGGSRLDPSAIRAHWPDAAVLRNPENLGFGPAANRAASVAAGDVLLFLNPDTRAEGEPFSPIARAFETNPDVVAVAPRLIEMDGAETDAGARPLAAPGREDQWTFQLRHLPRLGDDARELLLIDHLWPNNPWRRRSRYAESARRQPFSVEQAAAAALAVRAGVFRRLGGFDERYVPAWYEDVDLCDRLRREGTILFLPGACFRHRGGAAASRLGYARFLPVLYRNALRYRRDRYGALARLAYRALLSAGMVLRLGALPLRPDVPRSRVEAARAYLAVLSLALGLSRPDHKSQITNHKSHG